MGPAVVRVSRAGMWKLVQAKLERRIGFDPGPRVRPRIDRYVADESELPAGSTWAIEQLGNGRR